VAPSKRASVEASAPAGTQAWSTFADALLLAAAADQRAGGPPDRLAGLRITDDDAVRLVEEIAGRTTPLEGDSSGAGLAEARARLHEELLTDAPFALVARRARLDGIDVEILALLCAVDLHPARQRLVAYLHDDVARVRPSLHLVHRLIGDLGLAALVDHGRLRRAGLVDVVGTGPLSRRDVVVAPLVLWSLLGVAERDPAVPTDARLLTVGRTPVQQPSPLTVVAGPDRTRRVQAVVGRLEANAALLTPLPDDASGWEAVVRTATVHGAAVVLELGDETALPPAARHWIREADHLPWGLTSSSPVPVDQLPDVAWVDATPQRALADPMEVAAVLGDDADLLGAGHRLSADQVLAVERVLPAVGGDIDAAVRRLAAGRLDRLARRISPRRSWDDLIVLPEQRAQVQEVIDRYRNRALVHGEWGVPAVPSEGIIALFSGPSGTGKTTAAELVAGELNLDLFVVELSAVVSKYIGETEKNLETIFNLADTANMVLLFDEADALFGSRSAISDARDRYANMEVSYLLQRLESYDGLVILTTNLARNLDGAFLRRIHHGIEFPAPEAAERRLIWERWLQLGAPMADDVDVAFLAERIDVPGGIIRNACLSAAFLAAADEQQVISMPLLVRALQREMQKVGRLTTKADFGPWYHLVASA
jgi:ATP-dependent 26S proteasome regulatory subunit